jgi:Fe-S cluster biosynthesis and repair protein YggX
MAEADPTNELAHLALGQAYLESGMFPEASESLEKALKLNDQLSKAYLLLGSALLGQKRRDDAIATLTRGVGVADQRNEVGPRDEMIRLLQAEGAPVPELQQREAVQVGENEVLCSRCQQVKPKMPNPPFKKGIGPTIQQKVCNDCWQEWIRMGTKVINELRLPLADPQAQKIYDRHMREFLNLP